MLVKFSAGIGVLDRPKEHFGTDWGDPNLDLESIFPLFCHWKIGHFGIKYELLELHMNVYDIFGGIGPRTKGVGEGLNSVSAL